MIGETEARTATRGDAPPIAPGPRSFPDAHRPDRGRWVDADGLFLATYEWGDESAPVVLFAHGGFDFAGTLDVFAPLLAGAGYRVVSWDARGHGCSDPSVLYSWAADLRDAALVLDSCGVDQVIVAGHSKGGGIMLELAHARPDRVSHLINIDGIPSGARRPDLADQERMRLMRREFESYLDFRRTTATRQRRPDTIEQLAVRRQQMNPRLPLAWLEYLVTVGGIESDDGWRWRIDPSMRMGGFGPWRPEWALDRLPGIGVPVLGLLGLEPEPMGWGTRPADVQSHLPFGAELVAFEEAGHFVHIEQPQRAADVVVDFLARTGAAP